LNPEATSSIRVARARQGELVDTTGILSGLLILIVVSALFFWLRFHVLSIYRDNQDFYETMFRTERAVADAEAILAGKGLGPVFSEGHDDKGFALLVVAAWKVFGVRSLESVRLFTVGMDYMAMLALVLAAWKVFGRGAGLLAGAIYALYLPLAVEITKSDIQIYPVHFALILLALAVWFPRNLILQIVWILAMSLLAVFASMVRGTFALFPVALGVGLFLKYGPRRGTALALTFIALSVGGLVLIKVVLKNPTHIVSHHLYTGLADFANPFGLKPLDTEGWKAADQVSKGVEPYSDEYLELVRARAFTLIAENPDYYWRLIGQRVWRVLFAGQDQWWYHGFGANRGQKVVVTWALFLLGLLGFGIAAKEYRSDSLYFLLTYLYFGLCVVWIVTIHGNYFLTASVMSIPFAAFALSRTRVLVEGRSFEGVAVGFPEWEAEPYRPAVFLSGLTIMVALSAGLTYVLLAYATSASNNWKNEFLARTDTYASLQSWEELEPGRQGSGLVGPVLEFEGIRKGAPYLFHTVLEVERGRVAIRARDAEGAPVSETTYSCGPGRAHCFTGWYAHSSGKVALQIWDGLPADPAMAEDEREVRSVLEEYRHYGCVDYAKSEFFPGNEIEVSSTLFPNGHRSIPFSIDKGMWASNETVTVPKYWAARPPCSATITFESPAELRTVVLQRTQLAMGAPKFSVRGKGNPLFAPLEPVLNADSEPGQPIRFEFDPLEASALAIRFDEAPNPAEIAYLNDVSVPTPASYKIVAVKLYRMGEEPPEPPEESDSGGLLSKIAEKAMDRIGEKEEGSGYPTNLSFLAP
jgi:hypothetical protein